MQLCGGSASFNATNETLSPAGVNRAHGRWRKVGVVLDGDRLLHVVLTDVLVHLLYSERLPVLGDKATKLVSVLVALLLNANKKQQTAAVSATMFTLGVFRLLQSHTTAYLYTAKNKVHTSSYPKSQSRGVW